MRGKAGCTARQSIADALTARWVAFWQPSARHPRRRPTIIPPAGKRMQQYCSVNIYVYTI